MVINSRQSQLLNSIIREYVDTAAPIGSSFLVSKYGFRISPATVRNEMAVLEKQGYIYQPHTSAGRVPTEKGYKHFVETLGGERKEELDHNAEKILEQAAEPTTIYNDAVKNIAKAIAEISEETILVGFGARDFYYAGIANFFRKPEFKNYEAAVSLAELVDDLDEAMFEIFPMVDKEPKILIGSENPFGNECSAVLVSLDINGKTSVFGILGLMRMDYERNLAVIRYIKRLFI